MKKNVVKAVTEGQLSPAEVVGESSYLVVKQSDQEGKVVNPRLQFGLSAIPQDVRAKFSGVKLGDVLDLGDSIKTEILEIYTINPPKSESEAPSPVA